MKIINYGMNSSESLSSLCEIVRSSIKEGWQPYGYIFRFNLLICQQLVKYETKHEADDKEFAKQIVSISKDIDDKLLEVITENEILKDTILDFISGYSRYNESHGYFVLIGCDEYYCKSHENYSEQILKDILIHRKRLKNENNN